MVLYQQERSAIPNKAEFSFEVLRRCDDAVTANCIVDCLFHMDGHASVSWIVELHPDIMNATRREQISPASRFGRG